MDICKIDIDTKQKLKLKQFTNIISQTIFINTYDINFYNKYIISLIYFIKKSKQLFSNYSFVFFVNDSINKSKELIDTIKQNEDRIVLINYECFLKKQFQENRNTQMLGTLMRFYPLFDYDLFKYNKKVLILDIDMKPHQYTYIRQFIQKAESFKVDFGFGVLNNFFTQNARTSKNNPAVLAGKIFCQSKVPKYVFNNFLTKIHNQEFNAKVNKMQEFYVTEMKYGVDEYFLNNYLMQYIYSHMKFLISFKFDFEQLIKHLCLYKKLITNTFQETSETPHMKKEYGVQEITLEKIQKLEKDIGITMCDNFYKYENYDYQQKIIKYFRKKKTDFFYEWQVKLFNSIQPTGGIKYVFYNKNKIFKVLNL